MVLYPFKEHTKIFEIVKALAYVLYSSFCKRSCFYLNKETKQPRNEYKNNGVWKVMKIFIIVLNIRQWPLGSGMSTCSVKCKVKQGANLTSADQ